jgi:hypothetical protein
MPETKLIQFDDGTLVEVTAKPDEVSEVSWRFAKKIDSTVEKLHPLIVKVCSPVVSAFHEMATLAKIDHAEVELGLDFEGEGNIYITKSRASANISVKFVLKS